MEAEPAVVLRQVSKTYDGGREVAALVDVDLEVPEGQFLSVTGPSGAGKTTLLNLVGGIDTPSRGRIVVAGEDLTTLSDDARSDFRLQHIGMIFQGAVPGTIVGGDVESMLRHVGFAFHAFNLFPGFTVEENVGWPLEFLGLGWNESRCRAAVALSKVGLPAKTRHRKPGELSAGDQQRVAIARALVTEPRLLLADEPTGNLDSRTGQAILDLLRSLNDERRLTLILATHSTFAATYGHRTIELRNGAIARGTRPGGSSRGPRLVPVGRR
jgi:putative ABC transport system ATP-binding protein